MTDHWCLSETALFQDLERERMEEISARVPLRSIWPGQTVRVPHETLEALYVVKRGHVRLFQVLEDGRTVTTAIAGPGSVFGHMALLGLRMGGTWCEAVAEGQLCVMSADDVRRLLLWDPRVAVRLIEQLGARITDLEERLTDTVGKNVPERTAATLCRLVEPLDPGHRPVAVRLTHEQLSRLTGTTRERTTRALGELARRRLVRPRRGTLLVLDRPGLSMFADRGRSGVWAV
ncbi:Crp/Fnr family transcriptional regulator [Nocardiopsis lucentensis]|uniref:Crp/Fnr family transcriptional regulator n=1 Tax=Nocardiopsis lucentensis TaxID=53441 RepID=UPI00034D4240|nr:Crp/Fnr family transcriptional regulator [Nocardiopsis lucentensis]